MALEKPYLDVPGTIIFDAEQSRKGPGQRLADSIAKRLVPGILIVAGLIIVFGFIAVLSALVQINAIWVYGPYDPSAVTAGAQPD